MFNKKLFALLLAVLFVLSLAGGAMADDDKAKLTIIKDITGDDPPANIEFSFKVERKKKSGGYEYVNTYKITGEGKKDLWLEEDKTYRVTEINIPTGFTCEDNQQEVEIDDDKANKLTFVNEYNAPRCTITFETTNRGTFGDQQTVFVVNKGSVWGDVIVVPVPDPDPGFKFSHWSPRLPRNNSKITSDATYTAHYAENCKERFTITFVAGSGGSLEGTTEVAGIIIGTPWNNEWVPNTVPDEGYHFVGWEPGFPETIGEDWVFTAKFSKNPPPPSVKYAVFYHPNNGVGPIPVDNNRYNRGDRVTLLSGAGLTKGDLVWVGWELRDGTDVASPITMPRGDVTLYAVYGPPVVVVPKTGDSAGVFGWMAILGGLVLAAFVTMKKRVFAK